MFRCGLSSKPIRLDMATGGIGMMPCSILYGPGQHPARKGKEKNASALIDDLNDARP